MKRLLAFFLVLGVCLAVLMPVSRAQDFDVSKDARLGKPLDYNGYFPWTPPANLKEWEARREFVKTQVKVANGLWPMPTKNALKAVIHGAIKRDGYTVEKVYFESLPGFHVTGSLYRPTDVKKGEKLAGVLCPHGHWGDRAKPDSNGRLYEAPEGTAKNQLKDGAEKTEEGGKYPLQARCAQLARMGCVVFHYDMIGYGDSQQIGHPLVKANPLGGFADAEAELWMQSFMGLQTWNSVRALDFLLSLPEVDGNRIAVTGASGGGTQTFILAAVDDRVDVAWPAVMVSTSMQGGCICENCTYLRVNTGNIELAGLFAPRPLGMSAANDWTKELETKGLPELKALYKLYGKEENVMGKAWTEFGHNYNQVAREAMYNWFNTHLKLGHKSPVVERPFVPVPPKELSVYDAEHPRPQPISPMVLRAYMTQDARRQLAELFPKTAKELKKSREVIRPALQVMINDTLPKAEDVVPATNKGLAGTDSGGGAFNKIHITRKDKGEMIPAYWILNRKTFNGTAVVWIDSEGIGGAIKDGKPVPEVKKLIEKGAAVLAIDAFMTGAFKDAKLPAVNKYPGYTWGYNRPLMANRVHDVLTAVAYAQKQPGVKKVHLLGVGAAGPWVLLARPLCGDAVDKTAADMNRFRFEEILSVNDPRLLPGALRYGGMPALASLNAPHTMFLHNTAGADRQGWIAAAYQASGQADRLQMQEEEASTFEIALWLTK
jgi:hypothetical protein